MNILKALFTCNKNPAQQDIIYKIDTSFDQLDKLRSEGLKSLISLLSTNKEALEKERKRLEQKLGSEHPRVKMVVVKIYVYKGLMDYAYAKLEEESSDEP